MTPDVYAAQLLQRLRVIVPTVVRICGFDEPDLGEHLPNVAYVLGSHIASSSTDLALSTINEISFLWRNSRGLVDNDWWATPIGQRAAAVGWIDDPNVLMTAKDAAQLLSITTESAWAYLRRGDIPAVGSKARRGDVITRLARRQAGQRPKRRTAATVARERRMQ